MSPWLKRMLARLAVLLPLAALVFQARHYVLNARSHGHSNVQRVTLLNQPKPEPPKRPAPQPETRQPEPEQKPTDTKQPFLKFDDYAPGDDRPPGPRDDMLGLDADGGPGSDSFGLVGKRGGQDITMIGSAPIGGPGGPHGQGRGGPMAKYAGYATMVKDAVTAELNSHDTLRTANYDAIVMVWVDADGRIKRVSLVKTTGIAKMDEDIRRALATAPRLSLPPPADMPQPIDLRIVSKRASNETP
jgi:hypothetical protein